MDDFIDDDDGDGRRGRARTKARRAMQGVSSHGIQVWVLPCPLGYRLQLSRSAHVDNLLMGHM